MKAPRLKNEENVPATLSVGTLDQQVWFRQNGNVRVRLDMEDTAERVMARLEEMKLLITAAGIK